MEYLTISDRSVQSLSHVITRLPHPSFSKLSAVLILLYERAGRIHVLLTTRSKELRSHPGQTALPGGKVDKEDSNAIETAVSPPSIPVCPRILTYMIQFREANEEVALPLHSPHIHTLCTLEPFVSQYKVVVTPVVALLDDVSILDGLRAAPGEVAHIFDHPLEALLDPELARSEKLVSVGSEDWPYDEELYVSPRRLFVFSHTRAAECGRWAELQGQCLDRHGVPFASFAELRVSDQGTHGGYSSTTPFYAFFFSLCGCLTGIFK